MKYSLLRTTLGRIAMLGMGLTTLPACGQILGVEGEPVLTHNNCTGTLRVRITTDDTGPVKDIGPPFSYAIYDYLRNLNDTGGLRGCKIDVDMKDAVYDATKTQAIIDDWKAQPEWSEVSALFILGTGPVTAVAPGLTEEKKVIIAGSYAGSLASPVPIDKSVEYPEVNATGAKITASTKKVSPGYPYLFFPVTDYSTGIRIATQVAWKNDPGRMAMVHDAMAAYTLDPLAAGKAYLDQLPGMLLGEDLIVPQTSDPMQEPTIIAAVTDYVKKEIDKKKANATYEPVKWFWAGNTIFSTSLIGKAVGQAQSLITAAFPNGADQWKMSVIANNWGVGETLPTLCGPSCNNVVYGLFPVLLYGDAQQSPMGMPEAMKIHDTYRNKDGRSTDDYRDVRYIQGTAAALMWRQAVESALDDGHITPTGEDLKNALEKFHNVKLSDMTAGPVSFSPTDHRPQSSEAIYRVNETGKLVFVERFNIDLAADWLGY